MTAKFLTKKKQKIYEIRAKFHSILSLTHLDWVESDISDKRYDSPGLSRIRYLRHIDSPGLSRIRYFRHIDSPGLSRIRYFRQRYDSPGLSRIRYFRQRYSLISIFNSFIFLTISRILSLQSDNPSVSKHSKFSLWPFPWNKRRRYFCMSLKASLFI
jgi:hypothetical protein